MKVSSVMMTLAFSLVLGTLTGCGTEEVKSVDWWKANSEDAKNKVSECEQSGSDSENCKNAKQAVFRNKQSSASVPTF